MTKLLYAASAAAILTVAGHLPAMAQSSGMSTPMITCRDLTTMDRDMARSIVFYVSGFRAASGSMQNQASGSGTMDSTGTSGSTAADAGSGSSGSSGSADASGSSGSTTADAGSGSDVTGSTSSAGGTASGSSDTSGASGSTASGASSGASSAVVAQLPGFSSIDIDRIMADCASSPDRQISDMIGQGASGSSTTP